MPQIYANNATSTLSAALTNVATTVFIQPGQGGRFPTVAGADFMYCTLEDASGNIEIVKVSAHAANAQSMTIARAQQGTAARAWAIGDLFELRFTAAEATGWEADIDDLQASRARKDGQAYSGVHDMTAAELKVGAPAGNSDAVPKSYADALAFAAAMPAGTAGKTVRYDGGVWHAGDWWGTVTTLTVADNGANLSVRKRYEIDSSGGPFTVNVPVMAAEDWIKFVDATGQCAANNVTLNLGAQTCRGETSLVMDVAYDSFELVKNATVLVEQ